MGRSYDGRMPDEPKAMWYFRNAPSAEPTGPVELIELAGLLRTGDITGETLTQIEGDVLWTPFAKRREFEWARDMPVGVNMRHLDTKAKDAADAKPFTWKKIHAFFALMVGVFWYTMGVVFHGLAYVPGHHNRDGNVWLVRLMHWLSGNHQ